MGSQRDKIENALRWAGNIALVFLLVTAILSTYSKLQALRDPARIPSIAGFTPMSVLTGSMSPELEPGDMIITRRLEPEEIGIGDVVSYRLAAGTLVTHRVTDIVRENGRLRFQTKGDANNTVDPKLIDSGEIVGIYLFKIPKGGYIADLMRTPFAALLLIVVPALLLTGSGLKKLWTKIN